MNRPARSLPLAALALAALTASALAADEGPTTFEALVRRVPDDAGMIGTIAILLGAGSMLWCLLLLLVRRQAGRLPFVLLALLAAAGIGAGGFVTWQGLGEAEEAIIQLGSAATPADHASGQAHALTAVYYAVMTGGAALLLALAGIVRGGGGGENGGAES